jgi:hypothetical protein
METWYEEAINKRTTIRGVLDELGKASAICGDAGEGYRGEYADKPLKKINSLIRECLLANNVLDLKKLEKILG